MPPLCFSGKVRLTGVLTRYFGDNFDESRSELRFYADSNINLPFLPNTDDIKELENLSFQRLCIGILIEKHKASFFKQRKRTRAALLASLMKNLMKRI